MPYTYIRTRCMYFKDGFDSWDNAFCYLDDALVVIKQDRFESVVPAEQIHELGIDETQIIDKRPALMMAGFIDAHVHAPQLPVMAAYGEQLLDWLEKYTFPAELKCADYEYSKQQSAEFLEQLLAQGTTSAFIFTTSFKHNTEHLFDAALEKNMRIVAGKVLMDRHAPEQLLDGDRGINESRELIERFHHNQRLGYAVTPRFSATSTVAQLKHAGQLLAEYPDVWMQTHLSENKAEIEWTQTLFPEASDYLNTYEMNGLHVERSVYAHCVHLTTSEQKRIADAGSTVAFCPSSNLFLGSGLLDVAQLHDVGARYALATDVGAGTSLSMFSTMGDAYKVSQLSGYSLSAVEAFYSASLGSAKALKLDSFIGNFEKGKEADAIFVDARLNSAIDKRLKQKTSIEEELFVYMIMGDERIISETMVAGNIIYTNPTYTNSAYTNPALVTQSTSDPSNRSHQSNHITPGYEVAH